MNEPEYFGSLPDGEKVHKVNLRGGGLSASLLTYGATLQDLRLDGHDAPLVLGFETLQNYLDHGKYFGAIVGRFANRIGGAKVSIGDQVYNLDANEGDNCLHGGNRGAASRVWKIAGVGTSHIDFVLEDADGTMGFPGNCQLTASYVLKRDGGLQITCTARSDAPTIAGLTHHSYFMLDEEGDCREHDLQILADDYLPVDEAGIPTGNIASVSGTPFDFREAKTVETDMALDGEAGVQYDHNFCLSSERKSQRNVAVLHSTLSGIEMTVATTEPGLQLYAAHNLNVPVPGLEGRTYGAYSGLALETQIWPDAPNHSSFPSALLDPQDELRQVTTYRFRKT